MFKFFKDHRLNLANHEAEKDRIYEKLGELDVSSEEYTRTEENLIKLQESRNLEVRTWKDKVSGFTDWLPGVLTAVTGIYFGRKLMKAELDGGGVISSQAVNLWDKVVRKL